MSDLVGMAASITAFVRWLPQAKLAWRQRNDDKALSGLSMGTLWLVLLNAVLWAVYAVWTDALWVGAPGLVNGPLVIWMIFLVSAAKARTRKAVPVSACGRADHPSAQHDLVVTAPPGYGYVHSPCNGVSVAGFVVAEGTGDQASREIRGMEPRHGTAAE